MSSSQSSLSQPHSPNHNHIQQTAGISASFPEVKPDVISQQNKEQSSHGAVSRVVKNETTPTKTQAQATTKTRSAQETGNEQLGKMIATWFDNHPWHAVRIKNAYAYLRKRWRDLTNEEKCLRGFQYAAEIDGIALSLNFSELVEARAREHDDPAGYLSKRISKALRQHGLATLPFAFVLEFSKEGKFHAHGVIVPMGKSLPIIKNAFRAAGGKDLEKGLARQLMTKPLFGGQGFHRYSLKSCKKTTVLLAGRRFAIMNRSLNAAARDFHENNRPKTHRPINPSDTVS
tara:strand:- start:26973 stop:27836 length:864 start_codon:yes stop_codon:yes gene_type:complete